MSFKFKTQFFVYDSDGYYCLVDNFVHAYVNAKHRSVETEKLCFILTTETCHIESVFYNRDTGTCDYNLVSYKNPNIKTL